MIEWSLPDDAQGKAPEPLLTGASHVRAVRGAAIALTRRTGVIASSL